MNCPAQWRETRIIIGDPNGRHVRLKKNFVNRETIPHVGVKLRIPEVLLVEKMRTQQWFNVSASICAARSNGAHSIIY